MEADILLALKFEMGSPNVRTFLRKFVDLAQESYYKNPNMQFQSLIHYLTDLRAKRMPRESCRLYQQKEKERKTHTTIFCFCCGFLFTPRPVNCMISLFAKNSKLYHLLRTDNLHTCERG